MTRRTDIPATVEPRWHRRKEDRPAEILDAALHEFVARGFSAARLEDIARRAGCTKGTIFLYFDNKEELLKALVRETIVPLLEHAEQIVETHQGTARELLEKLLRARWAAMQDSRLSGLPKLVFAEAGNFPEVAKFFHDEVIARSHATVKLALQLGIDKGEFRPMDTGNVARVAFAPMLIASLWKHSFAKCNPEADPVAYFEASLDVLLHGIERTDTHGGVA